MLNLNEVTQEISTSFHQSQSQENIYQDHFDISSQNNFENQLERTQLLSESDNETDAIQNRSEINIQRTRANKKACVICKSSSNKLHKISHSAIVDAFVRTNILISKLGRACNHHFENYHHESRLTEEALSQIEVYDEQIQLSSTEIVEIIQSLRNEARFSQLRYRFNDFNRIDPEKCKDMLGT